MQSDGQYIMWSRIYLLQHRESNWLEVNHIDPRVGQGYNSGCWNHQDNLETLCHKCHVKTTRRQLLQRVRLAS
jgi:hypothetical protein